MNSVSVSIIMPCFMSSDTITDSIQSVLNQTYDDFELIVIDDFSTDNSVDVVTNFQKLDSRVKLVTNAFAKGVVGARNTGIREAKGKYIAFLDSDDLWLPNKLYQQVNFMEENHCILSYTNYTVFDGNMSSVRKELVFDPSVTYDQIIKSCDIGCLTACYNARKLGKVFFDDVPKEDYAYWLKILRRVPVAYNVNESLAIYRVGNESLSSNKFKELPKQFYILNRLEGNSVLMSIFFMMFYIYKGLKKR